jgi:hypothetical protein
MKQPSITVISLAGCALFVLATLAAGTTVSGFVVLPTAANSHRTIFSSPVPRSMMADNVINPISSLLLSEEWDKLDLLSRVVDEGSINGATSAAATATTSAAATGMDPSVLIAAGAVVAVGSIVAATMGGGSSTAGAGSSTRKQGSAANDAEAIDISIPYNAAAQLEYTRGGYSRSVDFAEFEPLYIKKSVAEATEKKIERDAAVAIEMALKEVDAVEVELQNLKNKKSGPSASAKPVPVKPAAAPSTSSSVVDLSIPYDAAAKLAYDASDKKMDYTAFKTKHEADAVAEVKAKQKK